MSVFFRLNLPAVLSLLLLMGCADAGEADRVLTPVEEDVSSWSEDAGLDDAFEEDALPEEVTDTVVREDVDEPGALCRPNRDGVIERFEMPLKVGQHATFKIGKNAAVDTGGELVDGKQTWDLSADLAGDWRELLELRDPSTKWFGPRFPEATYFTRLGSSTDLYGVFRIDDEALSLLGVVSEEDGLWRTELSYDPPVDVVRFPFEEGTSWHTSARVTGLATGVTVLYDENYTYTVDRSGELRTPFGDFEVLRIRAELERVVGFVTTRVRTYLFAAECFGTVATIVSKDNESDVEFTEASEVRRLAP
ncbi:MAG: hypothetical protein ACNA8W_07595 [Bradymonadaceae bacterium]